MMQSILNSENVQRILEIVKGNLRRDGGLKPVLFLHLLTGEHLLTPLELPGTTPEKIRYLNRLGFALLEEGKRVEEAIMLSEGWFVSAKETKLDPTIPPSRHPQRREVIVLVGRNAARTRMTSLVQPFARDEHGEPIWQEIEMTAFNAPSSHESGMAGLLDYLFVEEPTRQRA
jgi:hypothetical protein